MIKHTEAVENALLLDQTREAIASGEARRILDASHLTPADAARAVGVSRSAVLFWLSGRRSPTGAAALRFGRLIQGLARARATTGRSCGPGDP